jgi:uncharacterized protein YbgA (DUF1722 family)/uncharacterized protein YbbK (DUF523 family)
MKIKLGISSCLLGEKVRYDGQHKLDHYLRDELGSFVEWVPVCPEVECGLPIPRESMRLVGDAQDQQLITSRSGKNHTAKMNKWLKAEHEKLAAEKLCGFVFKKGSPSSGMCDVKIYTPSGMPSRRGAGLFAKAFMEWFPLLPVEDEGRLHDPGLRENFIERVFIMARWQDTFEKNPGTYADLIKFHSEHKLILMSHSSAKLSLLGKMLAESGKKDFTELKKNYLELLMEILKLKATVKKNVNVLYHAMGYFKKHLEPWEKQELTETIEHYHQNLIPLIVPVTILGHYSKKYRVDYLNNQYYFHPHPLELKLRNHV